MAILWQKSSFGHKLIIKANYLNNLRKSHQIILVGENQGHFLESFLTHAYNMYRN